MMKQFKLAMATFALLVGVLAVASPPAGAINVFKDCPAGSQSSVCAGKNETVNKPVQTVINVLLFVVGVLSVIMIIVGGIRYVISNGDSSRITSAKNTVQYAVVGLVVALLAYSIVNFVVARF
jgi:cytochrome bd-type quinol oxidase subunit 2